MQQREVPFNTSQNWLTMLQGRSERDPRNETTTNYLTLISFLSLILFMRSHSHIFTQAWVRRLSFNVYRIRTGVNEDDDLEP